MFSNISIKAKTSYNLDQAEYIRKFTLASEIPLDKVIMPLCPHELGAHQMQLSLLLIICQFCL